MEYCFSSLLWCAQIFNLCKGGITVGFFSGNPTIATIAKFSRNKMTDCIKNLHFSLTPSLAILMLFFTNLFPLTVTGPWTMNFRGSDAMKPCLNYWWTNLLYINNFYPPHMMDQVSVVFFSFGTGLILCCCSLLDVSIISVYYYCIYSSSSASAIFIWGAWMFTVQKFLNLLTGNFFYVFSQDSSTASLKKNNNNK